MGGPKRARISDETLIWLKRHADWNIIEGKVIATKKLRRSRGGGSGG